MVRYLAVGLLLVVTAPTARAQVQAEDWIRDESLVGEVGLSVRQQQHRPVVVSIFRGTGDERLLEMPLQVWVLKSDGTALPRRSQAETLPSFGTGRKDWASWYTTVSFEPAGQRDLSAVVVSLNGSLFVRPIPQKPAK